MSPEQAETVALQALGWLAGDGDRLSRFMAATGVSAADLRERAGDPGLLVGVLRFILTDDATVLAFASETGLRPTLPGQALAALPGGADPHWT
jgi:hypothetical protein